MAVHLPLSAEAQAEARILMLSSNNILSPGARRAAGHADAGHGARRLLPDLRPRRRASWRRSRRSWRRATWPEQRAAAARVPHRAGGRALLRAQDRGPARPGRVPAAGPRGRPRPHHGRADHLQRPHRARAGGGPRRRLRPRDLRVRQPVDAQEGHRQAHRRARAELRRVGDRPWCSTRSRTSASTTRRRPASRSPRTTSSSRRTRTRSSRSTRARSPRSRTSTTWA